MGQGGSKTRMDWSEVFSSLPDKISTADSEVLMQIPQLMIVNALGLLPSTDEFKKAISQIKSNWANLV